MRFSTHAFEPHRHDTYAIGISLSGVLRFRYRGSSRVCLPGQIHVLHPDVLHDGGPGTSEGFSYRILYAEPALIRDALDGGELPFVADPVQDRTPATRMLAALLDDVDEPVTDLRAWTSRRSSRTRCARSAARSIAPPRSTSGRSPACAITSPRIPRCRRPRSTLERLAGLDRFSIARQFRKAFGTSPDRYRTMRRLDVARAAIESGVPLARAAAQAGFADQSHMTRQFKHAYGLTPPGGPIPSCAELGFRAKGDDTKVRKPRPLLLVAAVAAVAVVPAASVSAAGAARKPIPESPVLFPRAVAKVRATDRPTFAGAQMFEADGMTPGGRCTPVRMFGWAPVRTAAGIVGWRFVFGARTPVRKRNAVLRAGPEALRACHGLQISVHRGRGDQAGAADDARAGRQTAASRRVSPSVLQRLAA